jgi:hypothetical protein
MRRLLVCGLAAGLLACATFQESMQRGLAHFQADRFEDAMAVWIEIEPNVVEQSRRERGEYYAYVGLTHARLGHRRDAIHYLALARQYWGALPVDVQALVTAANRDLGGP